MRASASIGREEIWRPVDFFACQACKFPRLGLRVRQWDLSSGLAGVQGTPMQSESDGLIL